DQASADPTVVDLRRLVCGLPDSCLLGGALSLLEAAAAGRRPGTDVSPIRFEGTLSIRGRDCQGTGPRPSAPDPLVGLVGGLRLRGRRREPYPGDRRPDHSLHDARDVGRHRRPRARTLLRWRYTLIAAGPTSRPADGSHGRRLSFRA